MMLYLNVPFSDKDEAKAMGARWNHKEKKWYVPDGLSTAPFQRWIPDTPPIISEPPNWYRAMTALAQRGVGDPRARGILIQLICWRCRKLAYFISVIQPIISPWPRNILLECDIHDHLNGSGYFEKMSASINFNQISLIKGGDHLLAYATGGDVGHHIIFDHLKEYTGRNPKTKDLLPVFKNRFSKTAKGHYYSQGCPYCDSLWGNFPLSDELIQNAIDIFRLFFNDTNLIHIFDLNLK